jgi:hypothetical protein
MLGSFVLVPLLFVTLFTVFCWLNNLLLLSCEIDFCDTQAGYTGVPSFLVSGLTPGVYYVAPVGFEARNRGHLLALYL